MNDIDITAGNVLSKGDISRYLDLGCSPGGFSTWVMSKNPESKGLGITLPVEMAGLPMVSFPEGNYTVKYRDVTRLEDVERELREADMGILDLVMAACIYR
jgi:23S rRNA U2552 (ribose-2'-O)-methylase RlmE/FtsJ